MGKTWACETLLWQTLVLSKLWGNTLYLLILAPHAIFSSPNGKTIPNFKLATCKGCLFLS